MSHYFIHPVYLNEFTCLADQCSDTCCRAGWNITVDVASIERWKAQPEKAVVHDLLNSIEPYEIDNKQFFRFKMNKDGFCYHMSESGFCSIHDNDSNSLQPDVCRSYPRWQPQNEVMQVKTLNLSCPEVARLAFQNTSPRILETSKLLRRWLQQGQDKEGHFTSQEAYMLRMLHLVWGKKEFPHAVRLTFLAKLIIYIIKSAEEVEIGPAFFDDIFANSGKLLRDFAKDVASGVVMAKADQSAQIWRSCFELVRQKMPDIIPDTSRFVALLKSDDEQGFYKLIQSLNDKHGPVFRDLEASFDRYLEISFMNKNFPTNPYWGNYVASFLNVIIPLYCIKMGLYVLLDEKGTLTQQDLIDVTYRVERRVQQDLIYGQLTDSPAMLRIDLYYESFLEL